jgi:hypothetical protein
MDALVEKYSDYDEYYWFYSSFITIIIYIFINLHVFSLVHVYVEI